jgi:hypothetical protein
MTRSRLVVAVLSFLLVAQVASGDCLTPAWELRIPTPSPAGSFDHTMIVDDFDGDGIADAVFLRWNNFSQTAIFQRGRGGLFAAPVDIYTSAPAGVHNPWGIQHAVARDLNRDGKLDLLLLENLKRLVFLPGNGDGTFATPVFSPAATGPAFAIADLTGDDVDDVVAFYYDETGSGVVQFPGTLGGTFAGTTKTPLPAPPRGIAAGDLDGDGANDVVAAYGQPSNLALLFGNDSGTFDPAVVLANGDRHALTITLADLENDGDLDIVAENEGNEASVLAVHRNRGGRIFEAATFYPVPDSFTSLHQGTHYAVADVTGDGEPDLLATNGSMVITRRGLGDGTFGASHFDLFPASGLSTAPIGTTDFDGDGRADLIIGQNTFDGLRTLRNHCGEVRVSLTATPSEIVLGQGVITAQVTTRGYAQDSMESPPVEATGTVSILLGETVLATGTLSNGKVTLNVQGLRPGAYTLVARYGGDDQYEPAESASILVRVTQEPVKPPPPRRRAVRP